MKALTDVVVTSGNAKKVIDSIPKDTKLIFGPDYNLGSYINSVTGRNMLLWNGGCHVHERFSVAEIVKLNEAEAKRVEAEAKAADGTMTAEELDGKIVIGEFVNIESAREYSERYNDIIARAQKA